MQAHEDTTHEQAAVAWDTLALQTVLIPGARQGHQGAEQARFSAAVRREAKRRGARVTVNIASSQRVAHVRLLQLPTT
jgi:hypothetical protein